MKIILRLSSFSLIALTCLPTFALRGVKEGGGDDSVVLRCHTKTEPRIEILGLSSEVSGNLLLQILVNGKITGRDFGIWDANTQIFLGNDYTLSVSEGKLATTAATSAPDSFLKITCDGTPST